MKQKQDKETKLIIPISKNPMISLFSNNYISKDLIM
jgi:hypothetical protein